MLNKEKYGAYKLMIYIGFLVLELFDFSFLFKFLVYFVILSFFDFEIRFGYLVVSVFEKC